MTIKFEGDCDPRFASVAEAFRSNFHDLDELGAALCIYHDGRPVVDVWGGYKDVTRKKPWQRDTIVCVYSVTKGLTALCVHMLALRLSRYFGSSIRFWLGLQMNYDLEETETEKSAEIEREVQPRQRVGA